jgi:hypothetical protein
MFLESNWVTVAKATAETLPFDHEKSSSQARCGKIFDIAASFGNQILHTALGSHFGIFGLRGDLGPLSALSRVLRREKAALKQNLATINPLLLPYFAALIVAI